MGRNNQAWIGPFRSVASIQDYAQSFCICRRCWVVDDHSEFGPPFDGK